MLTELTAGRATFVIGLTAALGCVVLADGSWPRGLLSQAAVAGLAALTSMLSPVAGLFLGVPAAAFLIIGRWRAGLVIGVAAGLPLGLAVLLSGGGAQPISMKNGCPRCWPRRA